MIGPPTARLRRILGAAATVCAVSVSSCQSSSGRAAPVPEGPQVVDVTMREYRFEYRSGIDAGRVVFRAHNAGTLLHQLQIFALAEDVPPINEQLHGSQRRAVTTLGATVLPAGRSGVFALDLAPGQRYALVCFVPDPDGVIHALKGMNSEFRARGNPPSTSPSSTTSSTEATTSSTDARPSAAAAGS